MTDEKNSAQPTKRPWRYSSVHRDIISAADCRPESDIVCDVVGSPENKPILLSPNNARHVVRCVNYHERLVEALKGLHESSSQEAYITAGLLLSELEDSP